MIELFKARTPGSPSRARAPAGTTTGRGSPPRPPAATPPTSSRWTTATSSNTPAAACSCRSTTRWRPASSTSRASPGGDRQRQGRRQDLRRQPRRQLEHADRQHAGLRGGRRRAAGTGHDLGRVRGARRRADREGRQARLPRHRPTAAATSRPSSTGCASAARRSTTPKASSASTRATRPNGSPCGRRCATAAPACRPTCRRSTSSTSRRAWSRSATRRSPSPTRNQIVGFQAINQAPLVMVPYPTGGPGLQARPVPQAVAVLQRLRQHRRSRPRRRVHQLLRQRPGGDRGARRRARRARVRRRCARSSMNTLDELGKRADRVHRRPRRPRRAAAAAAARRRRRDPVRARSASTRRSGSARRPRRAPRRWCPRPPRSSPGAEPMAAPRRCDGDRFGGRSRSRSRQLARPGLGRERRGLHVPAALADRLPGADAPGRR